jgi:hypothetical protein
VFCVKNEEDFKSTDDLGMRLVVIVSLMLVHHVQEVLNISKIFLRLVKSQTDTVTVASGSDCWCASKNSVNMLVAFLLALVNVSTDIGWVGLRVKRGHCGNKSCHHTHGVRVVTECLNEFVETIMVGSVHHNPIIHRLRISPDIF